jgi:soluble lytic murein transglycosylase-like protein
MVLALAGTIAFASDQLFYEVIDGKVIFTNTPAPRSSLALRTPSGGAARRSAPSSVPSTVYDAHIERVAREHGLDPSFVKAVALVESGFNSQAVSPKGAMGLMQLMPATARQYGVRDAFDPHQNLQAGARHLRSLLDEFGDSRLALAAYNAGSGAVRRHGGVPAYRETQDYVRKVKRAHERFGGREVVTGPSEGIAAAPLRDVRLEERPDGVIALVN